MPVTSLQKLLPQHKDRIGLFYDLQCPQINVPSTQRQLFQHSEEGKTFVYPAACRKVTWPLV